VDRRRFGGSFTAVLLAASAWAIVGALGELLGDAVSSTQWGSYVVYAAAAAAPVIAVFLVWRVVRRARRHRSPVSDPQLLELLDELETEQAKFDAAMPEKSR
jgi:uncharacterized membrane-anchored protein